MPKPLTTDRQRELLRVIKEEFSQFHHRQAHFYLGGGIRHWPIRSPSTPSGLAS
jgi:hypothetical protein